MFLHGGGCENIKLCMSVGNWMTQTSQQLFFLAFLLCDLHSCLISSLPARGLTNTIGLAAFPNFCDSIKAAQSSPPHFFPFSHIPNNRPGQGSLAGPDQAPSQHSRSSATLIPARHKGMRTQHVRYHPGEHGLLWADSSTLQGVPH